MTGTLPNRSVSRPEIGDSPNIPNVWPLMTRPTAARSWPWSVMCSGVIVMIRTITTWPVTSATIATGTFGRRQHARQRDRRGALAVGAVVDARTCRPARTGRAAAATNDRIAAAPTNTTARGRRRPSSGRPERHGADRRRRGEVRARRPPRSSHPTRPCRSPTRGGPAGRGRRRRSATAGSRRCRSR